MSVHYKFKSALDFETISFDGLHISVADFKKEVINKKKLGKTQDFDLQITNAQTKQEYGEDNCLIPKNTSLIIARVPLATRQSKKSWDPTADKANASSAARAAKSVDIQAQNIDLTTMNGTEEEKIKAMVKQSTMDFDPRNYQKVRGGAQIGEVPRSYRCHKCLKEGHWIKNCPLNVHHEPAHTEVKRTTGIPRSFREAAGNSPAEQPVNLPPIEKGQEIPDELICSICKDLFTDAVMAPCCGKSFCDECVRTSLLESEDNECPDCYEKGSSPNSLIPNRFLRNKVNEFKNKTGYNKPRQPKKVVQPPAEEPQKQVEENASETPVTPAYEEPKAEEQSEEAKTSPKTNQNPIQSEPEENTGDKSPNADTPRSGTPHDESDYDDNITVTVPKPQTLSNNYHDYRDRLHMNGRYNRSISSSVPNQDSESSLSQPPHQYENKEQYGRHDMGNKQHSNAYGMHNQFSHNRMMDEDGSKTMAQRWPKDENSMYMQMPPQQQQQQQQMPPQHRPMAPNQMPPNHFHQNPSNTMPPSQPYDGYHMQQGKKPPPSFYPNQYPTNQYGYPKGPPIDMRSNYGGMPSINHGHMISHQPMPQMHHRPHAPMSQQSNTNLSSVYQGVANKIPTGIIEDPLAAFEQIMKEKERRKKERNRAMGSPNRRRSRSMERRRSPSDRRSPRQDSRDRGRSIDFRAPDAGMKDRSPSRNRERHSRNDKRRRHRSGSYHSRGSRSYSRSRTNSPHPHSRSPHRKHSRSPQNRRSRSRSGSYNRNRHRDGNRRDYRDREEYRERSPNYYHSRGRGSYRGRGSRGGHFYRQDRNQMQQHQSTTSSQHSNMSGKISNWNQNMPNNPAINYNEPSMNVMNSGGGMPRTSAGYHDGNSYHDMQSNSRYGTLPMHSSPGSHHMRPQSNHEFPPHVGHAIQEIHPTDTNYEKESNQSYPNNNRQYDVMPPGIEPPPPGSEGETSIARDREWNDDYKNKNENLDSRRQEQHRIQGDRDSRSVSRSNNDRGERKRFSKSPAPRDDSRRRTNDKDQVDRERRNRDSDRREQHADKESRREKDKEKEKEKDKEKEKEKEREKEKEKRRNSSDDEKRERKSKDKKKKKKEEKSTDKKKKKEKKEKRDRDSKKEKKSSANTTMETTQEFAEHSTTPPPQPKEPEGQQPSASKSNENDEISFNIDESANIDLYGDINMEMDGGENMNPHDDFGITNSPNRLNCSDSILDIHANVDFEETDLQESESEGPNTKHTANDDVFAAMPELSKWERDDDMGPERVTSRNYSTALVDASPTDDQSKVTNEVLKRAENAIFARAINAIRPIEIKKICPERQKLYSNEKSNDNDKSPISSSVVVVDKPNDDLLQITVNNSEQERSVEIKSSVRQQHNKTPIRSIKERLGKKVNEERRSRTRTPQRKIVSDDNRNERKRQNSRTYSHRPAAERQNTPDKKHRDRSDNGNRDKREKDLKPKSNDNLDSKDRSNRDNKGSRDRRDNKDSYDKNRHSRDKSQSDDRRRQESKDQEPQQSRDENKRHKDESTQKKHSGDSRDERRRRTSKSRQDKVSTVSDASNGQNAGAERRLIRSRSKTKAVDGRKRSRSLSSSSSSSSNSNSSDSSSDSEDRKRKKKRKHKKQKKSKKSSKKKKKSKK